MSSNSGMKHQQRSKKQKSVSPFAHSQTQKFTEQQKTGTTALKLSKNPENNNTIQLQKQNT